MKSLREVTRAAGINASPLGVRDLAQRSGLAQPYSLSQLMAVLGKGKAAPLEEARFSQAILTPRGTALRGRVDLTVRSDGTYAAHFHVHDTGGLDYNFQVRAVFAAANGLVFALQHSGHVEGLESTTLTRGPRRDNDKDITGYNPLIKEFWASVKAGKLAVSKEYSRAGVTGFIEDVAKTLLDITTGVARSGVGAVIALGDEMAEAFDSLELGGTFGVIAGVAVFASGGGLVLAVTTGTQVGYMTKAKVKQRPLVAAEAQFAEKVFKATLPPADKIILTNLEGIGGRAFAMPGGVNNVFLNVGEYALDHPLTHITPDYPQPGQLFIHELTHVWQIHNATFVAGWVCSGLISQAGNSLGESAYSYGPAGPAWSDFNIEQQGSIVDQWFAGTRPGGSKMPMDVNDPYYRYIRDNVRAGRP